MCVYLCFDMVDYEKEAVFYAYPLLVCNPMGFDLKLIKQKYFCLGQDSYTLFFRDIFTNTLVKTYTGDDCEEFIGKRVLSTFDGLKRYFIRLIIFIYINISCKHFLKIFL